MNTFVNHEVCSLMRRGFVGTERVFHSEGIVVETQGKINT